MGFADVEPYGDPAVDVVIDKVCSTPCHLPGCNRNCDKMTGTTLELKLKLANLGPYTTGGWDLEKLRYELGCNCITGMMCNSSWDPYGCKIEPWGCELLLCVPTDPSETGNLYGDNDMGEVDFSIATLQVFGEGGEEKEDGWTAPDDCLVWVLVWVK